MSEKSNGPAWGYHKTEGAKLFEDGKLAAGYADHPHPGQHPMDKGSEAEASAEVEKPKKPKRGDD